MSDNIYIWDLEIAKREHQFSPKLAQEIAETIELDNKENIVLDFGCGKGTYLKYLSSLNFECHGFEGTHDIQSIADYHKIQYIDLRIPFPTPSIISVIGNVLCLEVAEHLPKEHESTFIENITSHVDGGCLLILSWAVIGQGGCGHHNEQNAEYVIPTFEARGFTFMPDYSQILRDAGGADLWWFKNSIYVFKKEVIWGS